MIVHVMLAVLVQAGVASPAPRAPIRADRWRDASAARSRSIGVAYARCAVRQNRRAVVAYLAEPVGGEGGPIATALPPECLTLATGEMGAEPNELRASTLLMRGLLFEVLYAGEFGRKRVMPDFGAVPPQTYPTAGTDPVGQTVRQDYRALMKIGDCAVRTAPGAARALLATKPASKGEAPAAAALDDAWKPCLPGGAPPFSVEMMRATVVEPLYRLWPTASALADREAVARPTAMPEAKPGA